MVRQARWRGPRCGRQGRPGFGCSPDPEEMPGYWDSAECGWPGGYTTVPAVRARESRERSMILVAGESLIDLIVGDDKVHASPGGGPFNAARTIARLGQPARFLGRFSADPFGQILSEKLVQDGVELAIPGRV